METQFKNQNYGKGKTVIILSETDSFFFLSFQGGSRIHSFHKYLWSTYCVLGTVLRQQIDKSSDKCIKRGAHKCHKENKGGEGVAEQQVRVGAIFME